MIIALLLVLSVVIGIILGKYFGSKQKLAKRLLILSAGFLIGICLTEVFPEVYQHSTTSNIGFYVIAGVLLQVFLENLTKGFEHGHFHHHDDDGDILPFALLLGLFMHAFLEGIPLAEQKEIWTPYLLGILCHNIPISFVMGSFLFGGKAKGYNLLVVTLFALASPLGMYLGQYLESDYQPYVLAVVGGIFLHISSVIIFESNKNHKMDWTKISLVALGVILASIGHLFHQH